MEELKKIRAELFKAESTNENIKKLKALECQINRHEKLAKEVKK
jgi:hypothetical protein